MAFSSKIVSRMIPMEPVQIHHSSHEIATQRSQSVTELDGKPKRLQSHFGHHAIMHMAPSSDENRNTQWWNTF